MPERTVFKYPLNLKSRAQTVSMPVGARIVHVHEQDERPVLWAEVNTSAPVGERTFSIFATGEPIAAGFPCYVGTVHVGWTVWHVYEAPR